MKYTWEASDIVVGRRYTKPGTNEIWLIGYRVDIDAPTNAPKKFVQVSLNDGMCCCEATAAQIAPALTEQGYAPIERNAAPGAQPVPEGYQLVPIEPTEVMISAFHAALQVWFTEICEDADVYKAMLQAAKEKP